MDGGLVNLLRVKQRNYGENSVINHPQYDMKRKSSGKSVAASNDLADMRPMMYKIPELEWLALENFPRKKDTGDRSDEPTKGIEESNLDQGGVF